MATWSLLLVALLSAAAAVRAEPEQQEQVQQKQQRKQLHESVQLPFAVPPGSLAESFKGQGGIPLFGVAPGALWRATEWAAVDDRVRGGRSVSKLDVLGSGLEARFYGSLDTSALKVAGFASQQTKGLWDLSEACGIEVTVVRAGRRSDGEPWTFAWNLKNEIGAERADFVETEPNAPAGGRRRRVESTIEFKQFFRVPESPDSSPVIVRLPLSDFQPYYRGRPVEEAAEWSDRLLVGDGGRVADRDEPYGRQAPPQLDTASVRAMSVMVQSQFRSQPDGPFELVLGPVTAYFC